LTITGDLPLTTIGYGARCTDRTKDSYPAQLQKLLGDGYEVLNFGVGSCTLIRKGHPNVWRTLRRIQARKINPDIVVVSLGTNDTCGGRRKCWDHKNEFPADCRDLVGLITVMASSGAFSQESPVPGEEVTAELTTTSAVAAPPVDDRQEALDRAINWFRDLAEQDDEGWFYPPERNRKKAGSEAYTNYYSRVTKTLERGVYEYRDTGEKDVYRNRKVGDSVDAVGVREKVTVRTRERKKIGTEKFQVERLRRDPDGDIAKVHHKPIYGPGGPDRWKVDQFGHNALVIYALARVGVDPSDPLIAQPLQNLAGIYSTYGYPDHTWDLAWSVATFSGVLDESLRLQASEMAAKLAAGMVRGGPGAGCWGPVCVDTRLLGGLLKKQMELSSVFLKAKSRYGRDDSKSNEQKLSSAERALNQVTADLRRVYTRHGWDYTRWPRLQVEEGGDSILVGIMPHYIYNQTATDMESTSLALYALGVAAKHGVLPGHVFCPLAPKQAVSRLRRTVSEPRGERIPDLVATSIRAIAGRQNRDGSFGELNTHQPISDFNGQTGFEGVPAKAASFKALNSPVTRCSAAQGLACLVNGLQVAGASRFKALGRNIAAAGTFLSGNRAKASAQEPATLGGRYGEYE